VYLKAASNASNLDRVSASNNQFDDIVCTVLAGRVPVSINCLKAK